MEGDWTSEEEWTPLRIGPVGVTETSAIAVLPFGRWRVGIDSTASITTVIEHREADFKEFATRVFTTYYASRRPLIHAHHFELNALARAAFMLGRLEEGLRMFQETAAGAGPCGCERRAGDAGTVQLHGGRMCAGADGYGGLMPDAIWVGDPPCSRVSRHRTGGGAAAASAGAQGGAVELSDDGDADPGLIETAEDGRNNSRQVLKTVQDLVDLLLKAGQIPSPNVGRDWVIAAMRAQAWRRRSEFGTC
ncbi:uncharacterized protein LAESUDRAFT_757729 [Laetiporus sulphureus 93-53]|uniref:Uncharacterized protein n=1 Tax=Laetiporus sulphureus 93-53 TaxID=1314785 RepID=A0A165F6K5_9APHY|nr:uncharacterized protein LAESUDRAFT_757729 [Laetiporus sulphureus 93-53]KZT08493.1 hypothetical protein LAESUDRAFT_757729 [Laetiporus sulphureus 93-53]